MRLGLELAGRHLQVSTRGSDELDRLLRSEFERTLDAAIGCMPIDDYTTGGGSGAEGDSPTRQEWADALREVFSDPRLYVYLRDERFRDWVWPQKSTTAGRVKKILELTRTLRDDPKLKVLDPSAIFAIASYEGINPTRRLKEKDLLELVAKRLELDPGQTLALQQVFVAAGPDLLSWAQRPHVFQRLGTDGVVSLLDRVDHLPRPLRSLAHQQFGGLSCDGVPLLVLLERYASMYRLATRAPRPMRVIAIVGAGASARLLPRAQMLTRELIDSSPDISSVRAELGWLQQVYGLDPDEFETVSAAMARTEQAEDELRRVLAPKYQLRYPVLKVYEILSHLMKHRFVDSVITLNFDELLDTSVRDELGAGEHRVVVSDRDCQGNLCTNPDDNNYVPIIFKLHGTASDPQTLRFTRASYYQVSDYIADRVREVVGESECLILNLGCGLNEKNLLKLLQVPQRVMVFNLSYEEISSQARHLLREVRGEAGRTPRSTEFVEAPYGQLADESCKDEGDLLTLLGRRLTALQDDTDERLMIFRSLTRHLLVTDLLGENALLSDADRFRYLTDRAVLEAAFAVTRARGLISGYSLVADRVKLYFDDANQCHPLSWSDVMVRGGLRPSAVSSQTYVIDELFRAPSRWRRDSDDEQAKHLHADVAQELHLELDREETLHRIDCMRLADHVINHTSILRTVGSRNRLAEGLQALLQGTEIELQFRADPVADVAFLRPHRILTISHLRLETMRILEIDRCDSVAASAETGAWLRRLLRHVRQEDPERNLDVYLLVAFPYGLPDLAALTQELKNVRLHVRKNEWQNHNRHMTIALSGGYPTQGIYFSRNRRSQFVSPVSVDGQDAKTLFLDYFTLWRAAHEQHNVEPLDDPDFGLEDLTSEWVVERGLIRPVVEPTLPS